MSNKDAAYVATNENCLPQQVTLPDGSVRVVTSERLQVTCFPILELTLFVLPLPINLLGNLKE